jgi:hypothetical protein
MSDRTATTFYQNSNTNINPDFALSNKIQLLKSNAQKELATQYNKTSESDHCQIFILRKTTLRKHPRGLELLEPSMAEEAPKKPRGKCF